MTEVIRIVRLPNCGFSAVSVYSGELSDSAQELIFVQRTKRQEPAIFCKQNILGTRIKCFGMFLHVWLSWIGSNLAIAKLAIVI